MSTLHSSPQKRSASGNSNERKDDPAKRRRSRISSLKDPPPLSRSLLPNSRPQDMFLLDKYIKNAIETIRKSLKPHLNAEIYADTKSCIFTQLDNKIKQRIHIAICDKMIESDAEVFHLYRALYNISSDLDLVKSVMSEYNEQKVKQSVIKKMNKSAKHSDTKPLPYSDNLAKSLSNESLFGKMNSLADEVMIQAAQRQIMTELYEANNNIKHIPKDCIDQFNEIIRFTLDSLDRRDSDWHWTKIYELYRKECSMKSDERRLSEICKENGFKIPITLKPCDSLYLDLKLPQPIISATNVILNDLKMAVKTTCVDVNSSTAWLFKHYIGNIIKKIIVGDKYYTMKPNTRTHVLVLSYRQYRSVNDDIILFEQFENGFTERTRRDNSSAQLVSELHFWQNDNLTSNCFFDMVKITLSKIIGNIIKYHDDASLYHINYLIYEIRSVLMKFKYMRNKNKWALTYSEIIEEFQKFSESKLDFYITRYILIKANIPDNIEMKKLARSYYSPKHKGLKQVVCKILEEKLESIFDKGIKIHKGELKIDNEDDVNTPTVPTTANQIQSGTREHGNNVIYDSIAERHSKFRNVEETGQFERIVKTNINEMTQLNNINMEQTAIDRNHDRNQFQTGSIVEGIPIESAVTNNIISTENLSTMCLGGAETSRTRLIEWNPIYKEKLTNDPNETDETVKQVNNIKSEPVVEDEEIESDIFLPLQEMTSNLNHDITTQNENVPEKIRQENVEYGKMNDTLIPISSARDVNEPGILNQEIALNTLSEPTNPCENMIKIEQQVNIFTIIKSEPIVEDDEMENDIFLPIESETVNQIMSLNVKQELITQDVNMTDTVTENNYKHEIENDISPLSSVGDINTPEKHLPSIHNEIKSIKIEGMNPDNRVLQDLSIEMNGMNGHDSVEMPNTFLTTVEREPEPEVHNLETSTVQDAFTDNVKNVAVGNVNAVTSKSQTLPRDANMTLGEEETWNSTSYSPVIKIIHNIVDEHLFSVIPELKKKLMTAMLNDNVLLNKFHKQLKKTDSQLIRLTGEPSLPAVATLMNFLKQFNPESTKMRKNFHNAIYVQTTDWKKLLDMGEVTIDGKKLIIEKETYRMKMIDIPLDPDATIRNLNTELVDQSSQTYTRLVVRNRKPTSDNSDPLTEKDRVIDDNVPISNNTPDLTKPANDISGSTAVGTGTKKKRRKRKIRKTKIYIENEIEQLTSAIEGNESTQDVTTEEDFDKILNELDPEIEDLLTQINENQSESDTDL